MISTEVLIIGGGPSGMISALCLAKLGVKSIIVERNDGINEHPKAHELNTRSIEILDNLGITDKELRAEAAPFSDGARILFCKTINEEFGRIDLYADKERRNKYQQHLKSKTAYLNISQTEVEKVLLRHVTVNPFIEMNFDHQWQSLTQNENGVSNEILEKKESRTFSIQSKYVLAADGAGSRCRSALGIKMEGPDRIQDFVSAYFEDDLRAHIKTSAKLYWMLNPKAGGTFIAHHIEKRWVYMVPIYLDYEKKGSFTKAFMENRIKTALGNQDIDINVKSINFWHMSAQLAESFSKGKIFLIGDAAHRFPPTGGLGMNTGIADAHNIGWKIKAVLCGLSDESLLDSYESERRPIAQQNTEESVFNYHKILEVIEAFGLSRDGVEIIAKYKNMAPIKWLPSTWRNKIINIGLAIAERKIDQYSTDETVKNKVLTTIADQVAHFDRIGLDIGYVYEEGALIPDGTEAIYPEDRVSQYIPSTRPGSRFPHLAFNDSPSLKSSHDLLGYDRFTLIVDIDGEIWAKALDQLPNKYKSIIDLKQLKKLNLSDPDYQSIKTLCEIESTGALLIRPDGHIAWRMISHSGDPINILKEVFETLFRNNN